jgi:hypothetical protein
VENEQAKEYALGVVKFTELADKIADSGYGSGRSRETLDTDVLIETDVVDESAPPELLGQFEAGEPATEPRPRRVESGSQQRGRTRKVQDDDDD